MTDENLGQRLAGNMEYEYKIKNGCVTLLRCYGEEERVAVPERIEDCPVTSLGAYIFSQSRRDPDQGKAICGNQLREIILPDTIRQIENYAFYGCFALEKMTFSHKIEGIGGGVFTGCHRLASLCVRMQDAKGYSLKNILGELHHEIHLTLFDEKESWELLIPEFYEEAVENTPARNVDMAFHGSGYAYRQCFADGKLQYNGYDKCLVMADHLESEDFCIELCMLRLRYPHELTETAKGTYISWLMQHRMATGTWCIEFEQMEALELLTSFVDWREEEAESMIAFANKKGRLEYQSYFMDYKHTHFKKQRRTFDL